MSASSLVLNNTFEISAVILRRTINENNRLSLAKLYKSALGALAKCPAALYFITMLCEREPKVAQIQVVDVFE
jgi:hypothetical protein